MVSGCGNKPGFLGTGQGRKAPRIRMSCYATSTVGTTYADPATLGQHSYKSSKGEGNGIIYTCRGGHIDIAHLRKGADWTAFLAERTLQQLKAGRNKFSFKLYEPSKYYVKVQYPDHWKYLPEEQKKKIAREVAIGLGQYFSFVACTWHEIVTWFGYRPFVLYPEFASSFSWEDNYPNLLGTHIAAEALQNTELEYDQAVTRGLTRVLEDLDPQSKKTAFKAAEKMRGKWFSGDFLFLISLKGRNLDIGLDDGHITPWLVPRLEECPGAVPKDSPVPTLDFLDDHGFSVKLEIEPREVEKNKILRAAYPNTRNRAKRIEPAVHFRPIMEHIERDAEKKFGRVGPGHSNSNKYPQYDKEETCDKTTMGDSVAVSKAGSRK
jgi:hypothetical protein